MPKIRFCWVQAVRPNAGQVNRQLDQYLWLVLVEQRLQVRSVSDEMIEATQTGNLLSATLVLKYW